MPCLLIHLFFSAGKQVHQQSCKSGILQDFSYKPIAWAKTAVAGCVMATPISKTEAPKLGFLNPSSHFLGSIVQPKRFAARCNPRFRPPRFTRKFQNLE